jgi:hypothetical protein
MQAFKNESGYWFPFYFLDIDPNSDLSNMTNDLITLKNYCDSRSIKFGVIMYGGEPPNQNNNQQYYNAVINTIVPKTKSGIKVPPLTQFQSYANNAQPTNLTECIAYTHSNLINDGFAKLKGKGGYDWAKYVTKTHPATMKKGTTANVSVTMRNKNGGTTWYPVSYFLAPASAAADNWMRPAVPLPSMTPPCIGPFAADAYNTVQFNFQITAPNTPGSYKFRWRMAVDTGSGDLRFGVATPNNVYINVTN